MIRKKEKEPPKKLSKDNLENDLEQIAEALKDISTQSFIQNLTGKGGWMRCRNCTGY
jgi:hypothetical protein